MNFSIRTNREKLQKFRFIFLTQRVLSLLMPLLSMYPCVLSHSAVSNSFATLRTIAQPGFSVHGILQARILAAAAAKSLQSCPTLCDPRDGSPPGSPVAGIPPGKNTGVGCHFLLQCMKVKSESEVDQSCPTLSDPMDCSLPGSSVHGIFQARIREWIAISSSRGSSQPTDGTCVSCVSCVLYV